jgi:Transglutaminase-like superfamily
MRHRIEKAARVLGLAIRVIVEQPREAFLRARMALWVLVISVLARLTSLPRAQTLSSVRMRPPSGADASAVAARLARAIDSVLSVDLFVFRPSCWKRAMVLHRFLALHGIESRINFGVRKALDGTVSGHAWLEHGGRALLENESPAYVVTFALPR